MQNSEIDIPSLGLVVIVIRNPLDNKLLLISETNNRGYSFPCGKIDFPENSYIAAHREVLEEAGIEIDIKGILRIEQTNSKFVQNATRIKVIFYAEPKDPKAKLKDWEDKHSIKALWVSKEEMIYLKEEGSKFRFKDTFFWSEYLDKNGEIYPCSILIEEKDESIIQMIIEPVLKI